MSRAAIRALVLYIPDEQMKNFSLGAEKKELLFFFEKKSASVRDDTKVQSDNPMAEIITVVNSRERDLV